MYKEFVRFQNNKEEFMIKSKEAIKALGVMEKLLEFLELEIELSLILPTTERKEKFEELNKKLEETNRILGEI